ncbi:MAG: biopolymer transporter ExbD [Ignavibacteriae bacterium]|nr:biopolymer transporter ExbD [Ignavibacteriota bacterium]
MADVEVKESAAAKRGGKKKKHRINIRVDMTPMVDVAFLLLTFFMLTTVFSKPQTMEINLPPDAETKVEVAESNLLTLRVDTDGVIWFNTGTDEVKKVEFKNLRALLVERIRANPKLITLIKVDRDGKYTMMVDIMDELNLANITRFTLAPMLPEDKEMIKKAKTA